MPADPHAFYDRFGAVTRRIRAAAAQAYSAFDIGSVQARFLRHIGEHSRISQADLSRATETAPTLTGRALETLVDRGWIRRRRSHVDRREYVLELTAAGQRARAEVERVRARIIARVGSALDERDLRDFERIAGKVLDALEDQPAREPSGRAAGSHRRRLGADRRR